MSSNGVTTRTMNLSVSRLFINILTVSALVCIFTTTDFSQRCSMFQSNGSSSKSFSCCYYYVSILLHPFSLLHYAHGNEEGSSDSSSRDQRSIVNLTESETKEESEGQTPLLAVGNARDRLQLHRKTLLSCVQKQLRDLLTMTTTFIHSLMLSVNQFLDEDFHDLDDEEQRRRLRACEATTTKHVSWIDVSQARKFLTLGNDTKLSIPLGDHVLSFAELPIPIISSQSLLITQQRDMRNETLEQASTDNNTTTEDPSTSPNSSNPRLNGHTVGLWLKLPSQYNHFDPQGERTHASIPHGPLHDSVIDEASDSFPIDSSRSTARSNTNYNITLWTDQKYGCDETSGDKTGTTFSIRSKETVVDQVNDEDGVLVEMKRNKLHWVLEYGIHEGHDCGRVELPFGRDTNANNMDNNNSLENDDVRVTYMELLQSNWTHFGLALSPSSRKSFNKTKVNVKTGTKEVDNNKEDTPSITSDSTSPLSSMSSSQWDIQLFLNGVLVARATEFVPADDTKAYATATSGNKIKNEEIKLDIASSSSSSSSNSFPDHIAKILEQIAQDPESFTFQPATDVSKPKEDVMAKSQVEDDDFGVGHTVVMDNTDENDNNPENSELGIMGNDYYDAEDTASKVHASAVAFRALELYVASEGSLEEEQEQQQQLETAKESALSSSKTHMKQESKTTTTTTLSEEIEHAWHSSFPDSITGSDDDHSTCQGEMIHTVPLSLYSTKTRNDCYKRDMSSETANDLKQDILTRLAAAANKHLASSSVQCTPSKSLLGKTFLSTMTSSVASFETSSNTASAVDDDRNEHSPNFDADSSSRLNALLFPAEATRMAQLTIWEGISLTESEMKGVFETMVVSDKRTRKEKSLSIDEEVPADSLYPAPSFCYPLDDYSALSSREVEDYSMISSISLRELNHRIDEMDNSGKSIHYSPYYGQLQKPYPLLDDEIKSTTIGNAGYRYAAYTNGTYSTEIGPHARNEFVSKAKIRRMHVKNAMKHAWRGYQDYAWGYDELKPHTGVGANPWGGMGTTLVDSLDTLWLMGLKDEFYEGRDWVRDHLRHDVVTQEVSVFETTIRSVGGLLAAYDVSGDSVFLEQAEDIGYRLFRAIGARRHHEATTMKGEPTTSFADARHVIPGGTRDDTNFKNFMVRGTERTNVAEMGSLQLEFRTLGYYSGNTTYTETVEDLFALLNQTGPEFGLYPIHINERNGGTDEDIYFSGPIRFGAMGDSFYEYMLKLWIQSGRQKDNPKTQMYRDMYDKAVDSMHEWLIQKTYLSQLTYIAEVPNGAAAVTATTTSSSSSTYNKWVASSLGQQRPNSKSVPLPLQPKMDHLACFAGGMLALGAYTHPDGLSCPTAQRDLTTAKALAYTCYQMYARTTSGIAAEFVEFVDSTEGDFRIGARAPYYILRPETVETFYILFSLTGDPIYQEWGWEIFLALEKHCKTSIAYGSLDHVQQPDSQTDKMESFFLAETLKYLYLLFDDTNDINLLETHVFTTEGHPLRVLKQHKKKRDGLIGVHLGLVHKPEGKSNISSNDQQRRSDSFASRFQNYFLRGGGGGSIGSNKNRNDKNYLSSDSGSSSSSGTYIDSDSIGDAREDYDNNEETYVQIIAPERLPGGYEFDVYINNGERSTFKIQIPEGYNIDKGERFLVSYPSGNLIVMSSEEQSDSEDASATSSSKNDLNDNSSQTQFKAGEQSASTVTSQKTHQTETGAATCAGS